MKTTLEVTSDEIKSSERGCLYRVSISSRFTDLDDYSVCIEKGTPSQLETISIRMEDIPIILAELNKVIKTYEEDMRKLNKE